ncbi:glycerate kinase [SAR202 cluster bacterium AD-802-E10_MRT_200m]|nr:glycerate kinase [SAR202 cluster bacterium AD-802-E10_MRT_200m]
MKIIIAPQAFKGSLTGEEAARSIAEGVYRVWPKAHVDLLPVSDGGNDTLEILVKATGGRYMDGEAAGPLGEVLKTQWGILGDGQTAVIETAKICGLLLIPEELRNPALTTSFGVGQILSHCLDLGFRKFVIGLGGSATNDGGCGLAQAMGVKFLNQNHNVLPLGGISLLDLAEIDLSELDPRIKDSEISVAVDVTNPLCGPLGASVIYGPQKGASPALVEQLDKAMERLSKIIEKDLRVNVRDLPGAGAAGGLAAGLLAFLEGKLCSGAELICDSICLEAHLTNADLVIVGEGSLDLQSSFDKASVVVARRAKRKGIPVLAVSGILGPGYEQLIQQGINQMVSIMGSGISHNEAITNAFSLVALTTEKALRESQIMMPR